MNRIDAKFKELKKNKRKAFIAYICAGDPDLSTTEKLVPALERSGADMIELGVPFSDPMADGPTIQRASQRALKNKVNLTGILSLAKRLRRRTSVPLILMTYYNPVLHYGVKRFVRDAVSAGVDGVIMPDLTPEDSKELMSEARRLEFDTIFLAAPTSTSQRIKLIAKSSTGFIYYVSLTGVTGARSTLPSHIKEHIRQIKRVTDKPVCIGFGISTAKQVKGLSRFSDGVIVGSAIVGVIEKNITNRKAIVKKAPGFVKALSRGLR